MKKIFTFCFFAFALILGTQSMSAQNANELDQKASAKTKELSSKLKLDSSSLEQIYEAYKASISKTQSIINSSTAGSDSYNENMAAVKASFLKKMEVILTSEQYNRFLIISEQEEGKKR